MSPACLHPLHQVQGTGVQTGAPIVGHKGVSLPRRCVVATTRHTAHAADQGCVMS